MSRREFHRVSLGLLVTVGLCGLTSMLNSADARADAADSPLGDGTALVFGPTGVPIPPPQYVDAADTLYLQRLGFTGTTQPEFIPDEDYPLNGPKSLGLDMSLLPVADAINAFVTSLPAYDANIATDQLGAGNLLNAILDPMSANTALIPDNLFAGADDALVAALGTTVNLAELFS